MRARSTLPAALVALALAFAGCDDRPGAAPEPAFSAEEERILEILGDFWGTLVAALSTADVGADDPAALASALAARMDPQLEPVRAAREPYAALTTERRMEIHQELFRRHPEAMSALMVHTGRFAARFQDPERAAEFRPIARAVFEPWSEAGAFWVFEGFGPAAVREVTEWTTETEAEERARKAALAATQSRDRAQSSD